MNVDLRVVANQIKEIRHTMHRLQYGRKLRTAERQTWTSLFASEMRIKKYANEVQE